MYSLKISVILPINNVKNYLNQCLDSIINQKMNNIEIICVNSSNDETTDILKDYSEKYDNIIVINTTKKDIIELEKIGIAKAKGTYLTFLYPFNRLSSDTYKEIYNKANNDKSDMIVYKSYIGDNIHDYFLNEYKKLFKSNNIDNERTLFIKNIVNAPLPQFITLYKTILMKKIIKESPELLTEVDKKSMSDVEFIYLFSLKSEVVDILYEKKDISPAKLYTNNLENILNINNIHLNLKEEKNNEILQLKQENKKIHKINSELLTSNSWKITEPLRKIKSKIK